MSTNLRYPYNWGKTVVNPFVERYGRGHKNLAKLLDIMPWEARHMMIMALCRGSSVRFDSFKRVIKLLEDYTDEDLSRFTREERILLYKYVVYLSENDALDEKIANLAIDSISQRKLSY